MFVGHYDHDGTLHFRHEADDHKADLTVGPGPAGAIVHTCPDCAESIEVLSPPIPSHVAPDPMAARPDDAGPA